MDIGFPPVDPRHVLKFPNLPQDAKAAALLYGDRVLGVGDYRIRCIAHDWDRDNRRCRRCGMPEREYRAGPDCRPVDYPPEMYEWI